jgi:hypothetical protein
MLTSTACCTTRTYMIDQGSPIHIFGLLHWDFGKFSRTVKIPIDDDV